MVLTCHIHCVATHMVEQYFPMRLTNRPLKVSILNYANTQHNTAYIVTVHLELVAPFHSCYLFSVQEHSSTKTPLHTIIMRTEEGDIIQNCWGDGVCIMNKMSD